MNIEEAQKEVDKWAKREDDNFQGIRDEKANIEEIVGREISHLELLSIRQSADRIANLEEGIDRIQEQYTYYFNRLQELTWAKASLEGAK